MSQPWTGGGDVGGKSSGEISWALCVERPQTHRYSKTPRITIATLVWRTCG
jgi:hypothetical protein